LGWHSTPDFKRSQADEILSRELRAFMKQHHLKDTLPTYADLAQARQPDIVRAIRNRGGMQATARRLGLQPPFRAPRPPGYWDQFETLKRELRAFLKEKGMEGKMPSHQFLCDSGRCDLQIAVRKWGGSSAVAARLGLALRPRQQIWHWDRFEDVEREMRAFMAVQNLTYLPFQWELEQAGASYLKSAIRKWGGAAVVAQRLGVPVRPSQWRRIKAQKERKRLSQE
jgi:hypothetical protein